MQERERDHAASRAGHAEKRVTWDVPASGHSSVAIRAFDCRRSPGGRVSRITRRRTRVEPGSLPNLALSDQDGDAPRRRARRTRARRAALGADPARHGGQQGRSSLLDGRLSPLLPLCVPCRSNLGGGPLRCTGGRKRRKSTNYRSNTSNKRPDGRKKSSPDQQARRIRDSQRRLA
jgi:hypothetical protein